jgi:hypothetical protein
MNEHVEGVVSARIEPTEAVVEGEATPVQDKILNEV